LPEIAVCKIHSFNVQFSKIDSSEIHTRQITAFSLGPSPVELIDLVIPQQYAHFILFYLGLLVAHTKSFLIEGTVVDIDSLPTIGRIWKKMNEFAPEGKAGFREQKGSLKRPAAALDAGFSILDGI